VKRKDSASEQAKLEGPPLLESKLKTSLWSAQVRTVRRGGKVRRRFRLRRFCLVIRRVISRAGRRRREASDDLRVSYQRGGRSKKRRWWWNVLQFTPCQKRKDLRFRSGVFLASGQQPRCEGILHSVESPEDRTTDED
jgi:hypothetical protein